ncbi:hypothetical protein LZ30DRAFT_296326 [Colletotrichum cereale]|nr:hypothetical protein LZ30DRAFT_296326 [Colletotrichum cereale]
MKADGLSSRESLHSLNLGQQFMCKPSLERKRHTGAATLGAGPALKLYQKVTSGYLPGRRTGLLSHLWLPISQTTGRCSAIEDRPLPADITETDFVHPNGLSLLLFYQKAFLELACPVVHSRLMTTQDATCSCYEGGIRVWILDHPETRVPATSNEDVKTILMSEDDSPWPKKQSICMR